MKSIDQIIELWPSMADLGRDLDLPYSTVAAWKRRGSIPVNYWRDLIAAAHGRGFAAVTSEMLIEAHDTPGIASPPGFAEEARPTPIEQEAASADEDNGQFSRWKRLRRSHFISMEEAVDHVRALRSEWDRR